MMSGLWDSVSHCASSPPKSGEKEKELSKNDQNITSELMIHTAKPNRTNDFCAEFANHFLLVLTPFAGRLLNLHRNNKGKVISLVKLWQHRQFAKVLP